MNKIDELTGALNRRAFDEYIEEIEQASKQHGLRERRDRSDIHIIMIDIDHFKKINDVYGHPVGDKVLIRLVELFDPHIRRGEMLARVGGEEFCIIAQAGNGSVYKLAERLRKSLEEEVFIFNGQQVKVTASFRVVKWQDGGSKATIEKADIALYRAKGSDEEEGRNRIFYYDEKIDDYKQYDPVASKQEVFETVEKMFAKVPHEN